MSRNQNAVGEAAHKLGSRLWVVHALLLVDVFLFDKAFRKVGACGSTRVQGQDDGGRSGPPCQLLVERAHDLVDGRLGAAVRVPAASCPISARWLQKRVELTFVVSNGSHSGAEGSQHGQPGLDVRTRGFVVVMPIFL